MQEQPYDQYDIAQNTETIPAEPDQPYDQYDIAYRAVTNHRQEQLIK